MKVRISMMTISLITNNLAINGNTYMNSGITLDKSIMTSIKIQNKKWRCTGVLFELLIRQITADTLAGNQISEALNILKKYFNTSTELGKEQQLYHAFFESGKLTEGKAIHFVDLILEQRRKLNEKKLAQEKYELIKEIKNSYDLKDFLSARIPNYVIHASIYKTFAANIMKEDRSNIVNISELATAKFTLVEHLLGTTKKKTAQKEDALIREYREQTEDLRLLSYKICVDRFNDKYSDLNDKQKNLLREYIENVTNSNSLLSYVKKQIPIMKSEFSKIIKKNNDPVMSIKLHEVSSQLDKIGQKNIVRDNEITAMMIALELLKEVAE